MQDSLKALHKRIDAAEGQLESIDGTETFDTNGAALPAKEILEELDEQDNVLSSAVSNPGQAAPNILRALESAQESHPPSSNSKTSLPSRSTRINGLTASTGKHVNGRDSTSCTNQW